MEQTPRTHYVLEPPSIDTSLVLHGRPREVCQRLENFVARFADPRDTAIATRKVAWLTISSAAPTLVEAATARFGDGEADRFRRRWKAGAEYPLGPAWHELVDFVDERLPADPDDRPLNVMLRYHFTVRGEAGWAFDPRLETNLTAFVDQRCALSGRLRLPVASSERALAMREEMEAQLGACFETRSAPWPLREAVWKKEGTGFRTRPIAPRKRVSPQGSAQRFIAYVPPYGGESLRTKTMPRRTIA